jgi:hypothetical protein
MRERVCIYVSACTLFVCVCRYAGSTCLIRRVEGSHHTVIALILQCRCLRVKHLRRAVHETDCIWVHFGDIGTCICVHTALSTTGYLRFCKQTICISGTRVWVWIPKKRSHVIRSPIRCHAASSPRRKVVKVAAHMSEKASLTAPAYVTCEYM